MAPSLNYRLYDLQFSWPLFDLNNKLSILTFNFCFFQRFVFSHLEFSWFSIFAIRIVNFFYVVTKEWIRNLNIMLKFPFVTVFLLSFVAPTSIKKFDWCRVTPQELATRLKKRKATPYLADLSEARGFSTNTVVIHSFIK